MAAVTVGDRIFILDLEKRGTVRRVFVELGVSIVYVVECDDGGWAAVPAENAQKLVDA